jgi:streptomycin 6-kinase
VRRAGGLELEQPVDTPHSLVVPAGDVVLKLNAPSHFEADHEADALERWRGAGAVRLLARDDARRAFVVERCRPGTRLWDAGVDETSVLAELLPRLLLDLDDPYPFRLLTDEAERWAEDVPRRFDLDGLPFERRLLDFAVDVFRSADRSARFLVHDLHGGNVLQAKREPWLVIDPKPLVGEREVDGVGLLRNAAFRAEFAGRSGAAVARRPVRARPRPRAAARVGRRARARVGLGVGGPLVGPCGHGGACHLRRVSGR